MLVIDLLAEDSERAPHMPLLPDRTGNEWRALTNSRAWARSGAIASWLIAQGYGPGGRVLAVPAGDSPQRVTLLLGALRAGALVVEAPSEVDYGRLAACSVDASVAERRLHIDEATPARRGGDTCRCHGDFKSIEEAVIG
jgi:acyl-CoA synthetase (AMP-forming)/AMP-acid ligase II